MKRGKPLRRTPLKRGNKQLKRTPLKPRSDKMKSKYVDRRKIVSDMLNEYQSCEACIIFSVYDGKSGIVRVNKTVDVHEIINRSQNGSILDKKNLLAICRKCHRRVTDNPKQAELVGLHLESWCNSDRHYLEAERIRDSWKNGRPEIPFWLKENTNE